MKKILTAFLSATLLLTACSKNPTDNKDDANYSNSSDSNAFSENAPSLSKDDNAEQSSEYDPFANPADSNSTSAGKFNFGVEWEEGKELVIDYAPTVSFQYFLDNGGKTTDFGLLLFVNGIRQPYRTEQEPENSILHIFDVNKDETKLQKIEFEPIDGEKGEEVLIEIVTMFQPDFIKKENSNYEFNHNISSIYPSKMNVTEETSSSEINICTVYDEKPITQKIRQEFNTMNSTGSSGDNSLDSCVYIETLKNDVFLTPEDMLKEESDNSPFKTTDSISLCMYGGKECKYRVSMYINHNLVSGAFDGADYIDMTPSQNTICTKKIDLEKLNLSLEDYNHLYFIAVPFYTNDNYGERMVIKSNSVTLDYSK